MEEIITEGKRRKERKDQGNYKFIIKNLQFREALLIFKKKVKPFDIL